MELLTVPSAQQASVTIKKENKNNKKGFQQELVTCPERSSRPFPSAGHGRRARAEGTGGGLVGGSAGGTPSSRAFPRNHLPFPGRALVGARWFARGLPRASLRPPPRLAPRRALGHRRTLTDRSAQPGCAAHTRPLGGGAPRAQRGKRPASGLSSHAGSAAAAAAPAAAFLGGSRGPLPTPRPAPEAGPRRKPLGGRRGGRRAEAGSAALAPDTSVCAGVGCRPTPSRGAGTQTREAGRPPPPLQDPQTPARQVPLHVSPGWEGSPFSAVALTSMCPWVRRGPDPGSSPVPA
ncbi:uncharacterized protein [Notamacropus eugenii]|uniref:uncharacterized protein n=1 Tax=Notamacropus eugenii TaxID=9315 RepID=UPI003B68021A